MTAASYSDNKELITQISEIAQTHQIKIDDALVVWFLRAYVVDTEEIAVHSLTDYGGERGLDAVFIDEPSELIHIVQGKLRQKKTSKDRNEDIRDFAQWATILLTDDDAEFKNATNNLSAIAKTKIGLARKRLQRNPAYSLVLHWVTTGSASAPTIKTVAEEVTRTGKNRTRSPQFRYFGFKELNDLLTDYMYGVAPAVPSLKLVAASDTLESRNEETGVVLHTFQMNGDDIGGLVNHAGIRLVALNIRGYLKDTNVNKDMKATLQKSPENFLYFNNGVTFICDSVTQRKEDGKLILELKRPQIINGQQTSRVLHDMIDKAHQARVLVRVMVVNTLDDDHEKRAKFVSEIVQATNWQNSIKRSDLKANDISQVSVERKMRREGNYFYSRKNERGSEIKARVGKNIRVVTRHELADAIGGCVVPGLPVRGKELMFGEFYNTIFNQDRPAREMLCFYWLMKAVRKKIRGREVSTVRKRAQWYVLYQLNKLLRPEINSHRARLIRACEDRESNVAGHLSVTRPLANLVEVMLASTAAFYQSKKNTDGLPNDPTNFFKSNDLYGFYRDFWDAPQNRRNRQRFDVQKTRLIAALSTYGDKE
jgi:hypothetical protein